MNFNLFTLNKESFLEPLTVNESFPSFSTAPLVRSE